MRETKCRSAHLVDRSSHFLLKLIYVKAGAADETDMQILRKRLKSSDASKNQRSSSSISRSQVSLGHQDVPTKTHFSETKGDAHPLTDGIR